MSALVGGGRRGKGTRKLTEATAKNTGDVTTSASATSASSASSASFAPQQQLLETGSRQRYELGINQKKTSPWANALSLDNDGRGVGSRPMREDLEVRLPDRKMCWKFWDQIERTQKWRYFASLRIDADLSPFQACQCIGVCPYDGLAGVVLNATCNYSPQQCCVGLFPDVQIYNKPGKGVLAAVAEDAMQRCTSRVMRGRGGRG